jgi:DNA-binding transcriptional LysR family regulator
MVIMITQRRLQHLLVLAEHAHFGRAAEALDISQPALTKSIQGLEAELGVVLLDRKRGGVALTAFGDLVVKRGKSWLMAEDDLRREIAMLAGNDIGSLKVALGPYPSITSGFPSAARLLARHPTIRIAVRVASWREVAIQVTAQSVDLGIAELGSLHGLDQFTTELIGQHRGYFFCRPGHPLVGRASLNLEALLEFPWVSPRIPYRIAAGLPHSLGAAGTIDPFNGDFVPAIEIDVPLQVAGFIKGSNALAPATLTTMEHELRSGEVVALPTPGIGLVTNYGFIYLKSRSLPPAALAYMQEVRAMEDSIVRREANLALKFLSTANLESAE